MNTSSIVDSRAAESPPRPACAVEALNAPGYRAASPAAATAAILAFVASRPARYYCMLISFTRDDSGRHCHGCARSGRFADCGIHGVESPPLATARPDVAHGEPVMARSSSSMMPPMRSDYLCDAFSSQCGVDFGAAPPRDARDGAGDLLIRDACPMPVIQQ